MKTLSFPLLSALLLTCAVITATAQQTVDVPRTISYQGLLTSTDGTPLPDGPYDIAVSLFLDEDGTQPLWNATFNTDVRNGVFNILLGNDRHPLPAPLQMNRPLWVGTAVNGSPLMRPLSPLTASPYALNLPDRTVTTAKLDDGAVTAEKMGTPYVAGIALNGKTITADGSVLNIEVGEGIALTYDEETRTLKLSKAAAAVQGDKEKGMEVLDYVSGIENWIGRQNDDGTTRPDPPIIRGTSYNTIAGGYNTLIDTLSDFSSIVGGYENTIDTSSNYSFIGGGRDNTIKPDAHYSMIGGGRLNLIETNSVRSTIGGGDYNIIDTNAYYSFIGGGQANIIDNYSTHTTIGGGHTNIIRDRSEQSVISGGFFNTIDTLSPRSVIGGGDSNFIHGTVNWGTIAGGHGNDIYSQHSFIGGGHYNIIRGKSSVIVGGWINNINGDSSFIGGGRMNNVLSSIAVLVGGGDNSIDASSNQSFLGGGEINRIRNSTWGVVVGGHENRIDASSGGGGNYSYMGGGDSNLITSQFGVINGGFGNIITNYDATIGGGRLNFISGGTGTISGGFSDTVAALEGVIAGGSRNRIAANAEHSSIGGGTGNKIENGRFGSVIGGGTVNIIATGSNSTIPGGEFLIAQGYGQTVLGFFNDYKGTMPFRKVGATLTQLNEPIFMIGNGDTVMGTPARSNAFEVSYNGHSIVYDVNGTGAVPGGRGAARGATYQDNIVYAWGTVDMNGNRLCDDFGVEKVFRIGPGQYRIELNPVKETGKQSDSTVDFSCASVTATISSGQSYDGFGHGQCKFITTSLIGSNNIFDVYINENWINGQGILMCRSVDAAFTFKVTGRLRDR